MGGSSDAEACEGVDFRCGSPKPVRHRPAHSPRHNRCPPPLPTRPIQRARVDPGMCQVPRAKSLAGLQTPSAAAGALAATPATPSASSPFDAVANIAAGRWISRHWPPSPPQCPSCWRPNPVARPPGTISIVASIPDIHSAVRPHSRASCARRRSASLSTTSMPPTLHCTCTSSDLWLCTRRSGRGATHSLRKDA